MQFRRALVVCSALCLAVVSLKAQAPATFRVGLKSIVIPAPSADLVETGPDYRVLLENLAPTNNRLVAGFLTSDELNKLQTATASLSQYALVEVPRRAEFADITPDMFKQIDAGLASQFGGSMDATIKDQQEEINRRLKSLGQGSTTVTLDKPLPLGALFAKTDASGYGEIMPVSVNGVTEKMAVGISVFRVHERVLFFYLYTPYKDENTVSWIRATSQKWADAILAANK